MKLNDEFDVPLPVVEAWAVLTTLTFTMPWYSSAPTSRSQIPGR
jgi:hypothetical protein